MTAAPLVEIVAGEVQPMAVDGRLDHNCLHCQLALPVQHFMNRHPEKTREQIIKEAVEVVAELVASSTPDWKDAQRLKSVAQDALSMQVRKKFESFQRLRS